MQKINAIFFGPLLAVIIMGAFTRTTNALAAKLGLIGGPSIFFILTFTFESQVQAFAKSAFGLNENVHFLHFLAIVFVITVIMMAAVSRVNPANYHPTEKNKSGVDLTPWRGALPAGVMIIVLTIGCYVLLAQ